MSDSDRYVEDENFVPEPTNQFGTLDTSGTAGSAHAKIEEVSPVFEVADKQNAEVAARALDPDDTSVPSSLVILPDDGLTRDEAVENIEARAQALREKDVALSSGRLTPAKEQAAEEGPAAGAEAETQRTEQGAAGGLDGSGTGTTTEGTAEETKSEGTKSEGTKSEETEKAKAPAAKKTASSRS